MMDERCCGIFSESPDKGDGKSGGRKASVYGVNVNVRSAAEEGKIRNWGIVIARAGRRSVWMQGAAIHVAGMCMSRMPCG